MAELYKQRLFLRLLTLGVLTLCLTILYRNSPSARTKEQPPLSIQTQEPTITVQTQAETPLVISPPRILSWDGEDVEFTFELINMSSKFIRAFAVKHAVEDGGTQSSSFLFSSFDLTSHPWLQPNQSVAQFDSYRVLSGKEQRIRLSVDYVEFSDGTSWGIDSAKFAEWSAG